MKKGKQNYSKKFWNKKKNNNKILKPTKIISLINWTFFIIFFVIGILNLFLVHPVPGIFYILLSFIYFPPAVAFFKKILGFTIPLIIKILLGLVILWGTLAVGDLAEMLGL